MKVFFHTEQLKHKPIYEYAFGEKIDHPETTRRAESILKELENNSDFEIISPEKYPLALLKSTHNHNLIKSIMAAEKLPDDNTFYPCVFPYHRDKSRLNPLNINHAGAFCFDNGTPLNNTTFSSAAWSAADAHYAAKAVLENPDEVTYALCRPPGHHASKDLFGGYCYFNNAAIAAKTLLTKYKKVAIIDIDFHHGNGTQVLFERNPNVLVINLHGNPEEFYPYFTGFESETGVGKGDGFNKNYPLDRLTDGQTYVAVLEKALEDLKRFDAQAIVISAGFDTHKDDPIGHFYLETSDYVTIASAFIKYKLPTVIVQEGGYNEAHIGINVRTFIESFIKT